MKKILFVVMIAYAALFILACGSTASSTPTPQPAVEQAAAAPPPSAPAPQPAPEPRLETVYEQFSGDIILEGAKTYTVRQGDTLAEITINNYGKVNGYYFPLIMLASRNVVADPDLIEPGMQLTIPDLQRNLNNPGARAKTKEFLNEIANVYDQKRKTLIRDDLRALANTL